MPLMPGRPAPRTWPSWPGRPGANAAVPANCPGARPAGRLMCTGTPARRCGAIRHCQLTASGTRVRPGQAGIPAPASRPGKQGTWRLAIGRWLMYVYDMKKRSMQEPTFLILTALAAGTQHGYGIITDAERISGGVTRLQTGTLYMALDRLRSAGLVEPDREEVAGGRLRRYYRLTDEGAALLAAETGRRRASAAVAAQRLRARLAGGTA
jgi:DNA-binding PadR family transcriptional regulator